MQICEPQSSVFTTRFYMYGTVFVVELGLLPSSVLNKFCVSISTHQSADPDQLEWGIYMFNPISILALKTAREVGQPKMIIE